MTSTGDNGRAAAIAKVRKLLALARDAGATENESGVAADLAARVMLAHNISELEVSRAASPVTRGDVLDRDGWRKWVAWTAARLMNVGSLTAGDGFVFVGRAENVAGAQDVYGFVCGGVERAYKAGLPRGMTKSARAEWRRSFKGACAQRIYSRAVEMCASHERIGVDGVAGALVVSVRGTLLAEVEDFFAGVGARKAPARNVAVARGSGAGAGWIAGGSVAIVRGVDGGRS